VFGAGELLARREHRSEIDAWRHRIRDPKDAPLAAAALVARVDGLVTGDKDLLDLERVGTIPVWRTRRVLDLLSAKQSPRRPVAEKLCAQISPDQHLRS